MSNLQFTLIKTEDGTSVVTAFVPGHKPEVADSSHPNFDAIVQGVLADDASVIDLFDVAETVSARFEPLTERISVKNGTVYLDNEPVNSVLTNQIIRFMESDEADFMPLVHFFENVQNNPNEHSREQLYAWLATRDFTITDDGYIVGYKGVASDGSGGFVSIHSGRAIVDGEEVSGRIPNRIGSTVEMPRSEVQHNPQVGCHTGLHVGTYEYAKGYSSNGALLEVHVNPRDVVSVPTDCEAQKMRVCRYIVVDTIDAPYTSPVVDSYRDDSEWEDDFWGDGEDYDGFADGEASPEVNVGDRFRDRDSRRSGRTLVVTNTNDLGWTGNVQVLSEQTGIHRNVNLSRLLSSKYERI